ncbi:M67 family metallopeptidase [Thermoflavimicrobium dichotomicum]|uniref:M67 family metallopeptidase n=1 Tax=Thermoflavimicrobium dichotomicum TaxID=46223 RepID=UPI001FE100D0|nr:M67 family metallopeptidase [Thermoflavimicrobium dichotomicum]
MVDVAVKKLHPNRTFVDDLVFSPNVYTTMIQHCLQERPREACGLLSGKGKKACTLWPMTNVLQSPHAFEMDIRQIKAVFRQMEGKGEKLVGIYHSHPTAPPYPSRNNVVHANYPESAYVIVSLSGVKPEVRCFCILNQQVIPIQYRIT